MPDNTPQPAARLGGDEARAATVADRTGREKAALVEQLKKTPVIQIACEKAGVSRMTYYRWRKEDDAFASAADEALADGKSLVNDLAESQLLSALKSGDPWSIQYWLRHHHRDYAAKMELVANLKTDGKLTPEEEAAFEEAMRLSHVVMEARAESFEPAGNPKSSSSLSFPSAPHGTHHPAS